MATVTISRSFGSDGSAVAQRVAQLLDWTLIDQNFVEVIAKRVGLPTSEIAEHEERTAGFVERVAQSLATTAPDGFAGVTTGVGEPLLEDVIHRVTQTVITEVVQQGNSVIVGRGAHAYLEDRSQTLRVFVTADESTRITRIIERLQLSRRAAVKLMSDTDKNRKKYVKTYYGRSWSDPGNYHLVLNTALLTVEECAATIAALVRGRHWTP